MTFLVAQMVICYKSKPAKGRPRNQSLTPHPTKSSNGKM